VFLALALAVLVNNGTISCTTDVNYGSLAKVHELVALSVLAAYTNVGRVRSRNTPLIDYEFLLT
jgi:hypothetical protein